MSGDDPVRYEIAVCITHEPTEDGPRPLPWPFRAAFDRDTREAAEALVDQFFAAAAKAGAAGVILYRPADWSAWTVWRPVGDREPIPAMVTTAADGAKLVQRAKAGRATIDLTLTTSSPYLYDVFQVSKGSIPAKIDYHVTAANSDMESSA